MLRSSDCHQQTSFFGTDLLDQIDQADPLIMLSKVIPWEDFESEFSAGYSQGKGRPSIPIRRLVGLLILKQLENLSDEQVVIQWKRNPYYQAFCGLKSFQNKTCAVRIAIHISKSTT